MSLIDQYHRTVPEYYSTMYMDGYSPEEILFAARRSMLAEREANEIPSVKIVSEVKIR